MPLYDDDEPIVVRHIVVDGSHFFVDPEGCERTDGLCVGSRNMKEAYEQVGPVLEFLLKKNFGLKISCKPKLTYKQYERLFLASIGGDLGRGGWPGDRGLPCKGEDTRLWATTVSTNHLCRAAC